MPLMGFQQNTRKLSYNLIVNRSFHKKSKQY